MMKMQVGQFILRNSILHKIDARAKLISLILLIVAITLTTNIVGYLVVFSILIIACAFSKLSVKEAILPLSKLWLFFFIIFLMNALFFQSENAIFSWWIFSLTVGGIIQGFNVVLHVALIMVLCNVFMCTTSPVEITGAIEFLISPLSLVKIPVEDIAMILGVALQFIPTLMREADTIKKAQIARGARFESKKLLERAKSYFPLIIPIFISAFRRAEELSLAMEARGYRKSEAKTKRKSAHMRCKDYGAILASLAVFCGLMYIY